MEEGWTESDGVRLGVVLQMGWLVRDVLLELDVLELDWVKGHFDSLQRCLEMKDTS